MADIVNRKLLRRVFSDQDLVDMVTRNPAKTLGWDAVLGQVAPGFLADLLVVDGVHDDPYTNLVRATDRRVQLVVIRGEPLYGDENVMRELKSYPEAVGEGTVRRQQYEIIGPVEDDRFKAVDFSRARSKSVRDVIATLSRAMTFNRDDLRRNITVARVRSALVNTCKQAPPADPPSAADFDRFVKCVLPGGLTPIPLDPVFTSTDPDHFRRLHGNPNAPEAVRRLGEVYGFSAKEVTATGRVRSTAPPQVRCR